MSFPTETNLQEPFSQLGVGHACSGLPSIWASLSLFFFSCISDISGTSQMWEKLERTVLDNLSPEVQEDYGQDYILSERSFLNLMKTCTDPDISPVLLDVRHAISAQSPFAFYAPGKLSYLWLCFASVSPTGIFDYLSRKIYTYSKKMPRVLSTSNWENEAR